VAQTSAATEVGGNVGTQERPSNGLSYDRRVTRKRARKAVRWHSLGHAVQGETPTTIQFDDKPRPKRRRVARSTSTRASVCIAEGKEMETSEKHDILLLRIAEDKLAADTHAQLRRAFAKYEQDVRAFLSGQSAPTTPTSRVACAALKAMTDHVCTDYDSPRARGARVDFRCVACGQRREAHGDASGGVTSCALTLVRHLVQVERDAPARVGLLKVCTQQVRRLLVALHVTQWPQALVDLLMRQFLLTRHRTVYTQARFTVRQLWKGDAERRHLLSAFMRENAAETAAWISYEALSDLHFMIQSSIDDCEDAGQDAPASELRDLASRYGFCMRPGSRQLMGDTSRYLDLLPEDTGKGCQVRSLLFWNIASWRSRVRKDHRNQGLLRVLEDAGWPDYVLLSETRASWTEIRKDVVTLDALCCRGYKTLACAWSDDTTSLKSGYAGLMVLCKGRPQDVRVGVGDGDLDHEARVITCVTDKHIVVGCYLHNTGSPDNLQRLDDKCTMLNALAEHIAAQRKLYPRHTVIVGGDLNVAPQPSDWCQEAFTPIVGVGGFGKYKQYPAINRREVRAYAQFLRACGLSDAWLALRPGDVGPPCYTWRASDKDDAGMRLDHALVDPGLLQNSGTPRVVDVRNLIDHGNSDHSGLLVLMDTHAPAKAGALAAVAMDQPAPMPQVSPPPLPRAFMPTGDAVVRTVATGLKHKVVLCTLPRLVGVTPELKPVHVSFDLTCPHTVLNVCDPGRTSEERYLTSSFMTVTSRTHAQCTIDSFNHGPKLTPARTCTVQLDLSMGVGQPMVAKVQACVLAAYHPGLPDLVVGADQAWHAFRGVRLQPAGPFNCFTFGLWPGRSFPDLSTMQTEECKPLSRDEMRERLYGGFEGAPVLSQEQVNALADLFVEARARCGPQATDLSSFENARWRKPPAEEGKEDIDQQPAQESSSACAAEAGASTFEATFDPDVGEAVGVVDGQDSPEQSDEVTGMGMQVMEDSGKMSDSPKPFVSLDLSLGNSQWETFSVMLDSGSTFDLLSPRGLQKLCADGHVLRAVRVNKPLPSITTANGVRQQATQCVRVSVRLPSGDELPRGEFMVFAGLPTDVIIGYLTMDAQRSAIDWDDRTWRVRVRRKQPRVRVPFESKYGYANWRRPGLLYATEDRWFGPRRVQNFAVQLHTDADLQSRPTFGWVESVLPQGQSQFHIDDTLDYRPECVQMQNLTDEPLFIRRGSLLALFMHADEHFLGVNTTAELDAYYEKQKRRHRREADKDLDWEPPPPDSSQQCADVTVAQSQSTTAAAFRPGQGVRPPECRASDATACAAGDSVPPDLNVDSDTDTDVSTDCDTDTDTDSEAGEPPLLKVNGGRGFPARKNVSSLSYAEVQRQLREHWACKHIDWTATRQAHGDAEFEKIQRRVLSRQATFTDGVVDMTKAGRPLHPHKLKILTTVKNPPVRSRPYRRTFRDRGVVRDEVQKKLKAGVCEPSTSPWANNVVVVRRDGKVRLCTDCRTLNKYTVKDSYSLPLQADLFDLLGGSTWFTCCDAAASFHQLPLADERTKNLTTFVTPDGATYRYKYAAFGLVNAPAAWCRLINSCLVGLNWKICLTFMDDCLIYTKTDSLDDHLDAMDRVFDRLDSYGIKLKASKCTFVVRELPFLGHIVSDKGLSPNPAKVEAIRVLKPPTTVRELRQQLGLEGYYRKFVGDFATIAAPLTDLLNNVSSKRQRIKWSEECQHAFDTLKKLLTSEPIMCWHPDWSAPFTLDVDASPVGLGGVLSQRIDGKERVIMYISRKLKANERKYQQYEREALGLVWAMETLRPYLLGRHFTVRTDNNAVKFLMERPHSARIMHWVMRIQEFNYTAVHRPGKRHSNCDTLSRQPVDSTRPYGEREVDDLYEDARGGAAAEPLAAVATRSMQARAQARVDAPECDGASEASADSSAGTGLREEVPDDFAQASDSEDEDVAQDGPLPSSGWMKGPAGAPPSARAEASLDTQQDDDDGLDMVLTRDVFIRAQQDPDDAQMAALRPGAKALGGASVAAQFAVKQDGLMVKLPSRPRETERIVVPAKLRRQVLRHFHTSPLSAHAGRKRVIHLVSRHFWWQSLSKDVRNWVRRCAVCARRKVPRPMHVGPQRHLQVKRPWQTVGIDFVGPCLETTEGNKYIMTIVDHFSRYPMAIAVPDQRAETVMRVLMERVVAHHGVPEVVLTDQAKSFLADGVKKLCKRMGSRKIETSGYHSAGNGICERFHRWLNVAMTMLYDRNTVDWDLHLPSILMAYRMTVNETTGYSPAYLIYGRHPSMPLDLLKELDTEPAPFHSHAEWARHVQRSLSKAFKMARALQERALVSRQARAKRKPAPVFTAGQPVHYWVRKNSDHVVHLEGKTLPLRERWTNWWQPGYNFVRWDGPQHVMLRTRANRVFRAHINRVDPRPVQEQDDWCSPSNLNAELNRSGKQCVVQDTIITRPLRQGELFVFATRYSRAHPSPFGVGKVLKAASDGSPCVWQWLGNAEYRLRGSYLPCWLNTDTDDYYYRASLSADARRAEHTPYTNEDQSQPMRIGPEDVIVRGYGLLDETCSFMPVVWDEIRSNRLVKSRLSKHNRA
jgi:exonuclease III